MPRAPTELTVLQSAQEDLAEIKQHNPDHAARILTKINDWSEKIKWGRTPQKHLRYLTGSDEYNFYRERVGNAGYRIVYEISGDRMTVVGIVPKGEQTYDLAAFRRRMDR
jgi:Plasmid stabilisation system protein.